MRPRLLVSLDALFSSGDRRLTEPSLVHDNNTFVLPVFYQFQLSLLVSPFFHIGLSFLCCLLSPYLWYWFIVQERTHQVISGVSKQLKYYCHFHPFKSKGHCGL